MALSYQQALDELAALRASNNLTEASLCSLITSLDVTSSGSVTVFYAGKVGEISANRVAEEMKADSSESVVTKVDRIVRSDETLTQDLNGNDMGNGFNFHSLPRTPSTYLEISS